MAKTKNKSSHAGYSASLIVMGKKYSSSGLTAIDAITNLKPGNVHGSGVLVIEGNGHKKERIVPTVQLNRLFSPSRLTREIALKSFGQLFDF